MSLSVDTFAHARAYAEHGSLAHAVDGCGGEVRSTSRGLYCHECDRIVNRDRVISERPLDRDEVGELLDEIYSLRDALAAAEAEADRRVNTIDDHAHAMAHSPAVLG